ncbi:MAG TPA: permease-like cell division protein FtsX [Chloroflexota bacterium]|jgi:cell division transport system permease protein|nr:permease-like cell division protein FtsX [Chloroflexota bacterium]
MRQHVQRSEERWALALQRELHAVMRVLEVARYAVTTAAVNFWRHRTMSAAAVFAAVVMMLMLNGFAVVVSHLNVTLTALDQKVNLVIYLKDEAGQEDAARLVEQLRAEGNILEVSYFTKDEAMARLKTQLADRAELLDMVQDNPLPASVEVRVRDPGSIAALAERLRQNPLVEEIPLQQDVVDNLVRITRFARFAGTAMVAGMVGVTLFVIMNTIRLAVYARRQEIEIMKLVGATDWFIRWPFLLEGVLYGLIGAAITILVVVATYRPLEGQFLSMVQFLPVNLDPTFPLKLSGLTVLVGVGVGAAGSYLSVRRFLDV